MNAEPPFAAILAMPTCRLGVRIRAGALTELVFLPPTEATQPANDPLCVALEQALSRYLAAACDFPALPRVLDGTPFQRRVWAAISAIPRGKILRYRDIADSLASAPRAVGQACGANPLPLIIPCHRVLASTGLGGFANHTTGWLVETKRWLLWHEGVLA
ncbi:methylated-DNA--[protein]-cysteine S-methyltransferase [Niveibacterium sp. 24ML]|uniref:methylated-DNA--[protein]-cysteine S-methyltransferase n=1 Tax=Niveibacterium sp. 24ML TaxID=2985512 RepID=UPI002270B817|nr:methylated-DNA--[protein]-cysteine S-methyltransferase [Niveibacterium sp. 24ML]MCX9154556.1 methylated-DNA--[protein]-cysteine S-methyltransferase [Niveibacterium sp. 24ML]